MSQFRVRQAELRDLPRVTTVGLASLPDDPAFVWLYRYRHQYPDDNYFFWLQVFKTYLYTPNITFLVAEEVASLDKKSEDRGEAVATIFAFAIWERNEKKTATQALTSLYNNCSLETIHRCVTKLENWAIRQEFPRRDADVNRLGAFEKGMNYTHSKYWEKTYPQNFYLSLLATHPDYRRRGAGTALTQWGIDQAMTAGFDVGLEASPMGFPLYQHLGFIHLEDHVLKADNDSTSVVLRIMVYEKDQKSLSV
ncbi:hypothetical protein CUC08_Gglean003295 [Alternaria sp. MG1]|jgi:ribosomal protein S18 acetylase RimI-like enzyme|uniref:N-acetyltransferase domain-containing protein n=1 Tax=Alternaria tenuissima TaxID=119927 RepID=A0ABY0GJY0_9PLEO|nr:hypothetical protein CUC08_Gglean003295 [Alternaria sp. MG1]RYO06843.1 hypothetical protein AA0119_g2626 [Alternaria tenuissima]RYO18763.1 hypothetical protein AA0121_g4813 [Alternaria tenuissima]RYO67836.1 hypothetical protein AA0116_g1478 [Alternaria tenuissima]